MIYKGRPNDNNSDLKDRDHVPVTTDGSVGRTFSALIRLLNFNGQERTTGTLLTADVKAYIDGCDVCMRAKVYYYYIGHNKPHGQSAVYICRYQQHVHGKILSIGFVTGLPDGQVLDLSQSR